MQHEIQAVFVRGQDEPVAYFSDADQAQRWRRAEHGDNAVVVAVQASITDGALKDARETAAASFPNAGPTGEAEPGTTADPDAALRGEIRAELEAKQRRERITAEVERDMAAEEKTGRREAAPEAEAAVPRRRP